MTLSLHHINHTVGNTKNWTMDYGPWMLPGEIISSFTLVSSSTTLLVQNAAIFLGKQIQFQITGGVAGELATLTSTVTTSKTEVKVDTLTVSVNNP